MQVQNKQFMIAIYLQLTPLLRMLLLIIRTVSCLYLNMILTHGFVGSKCHFSIRIYWYHDAGLFVNQKQVSIHLDGHLIFYQVNSIMLCMCIVCLCHHLDLSLPSFGFVQALLHHHLDYPSYFFLCHDLDFQVISFCATIWNFQDLSQLLCHHLQLSFVMGWNYQNIPVSDMGWGYKAIWFFLIV